MSRQREEDSNIGRAIAALSERDTWTPLELQQILCRICDSKDQAINLNDHLRASGYIERRIVVLPKAKARAQS